MGHSSKAGENIFWAMNRNEPGIIKRILNALERFIARIRGKDAYLAVEQRQAAERLRDMLTGELKRAYGTDVKGEAAVESDEGKRHSLAGANSRTADLNSLGGAYQMYQNGVSMDTIRKRTGWWLGKDGKWRYEISDKEMRFNPEGYVDNPQTVGDYVKHDRLFAAYPWIADIPVYVSDVVGGDPSSLGRYIPSEKIIEIKAGITSEKARTALAHELQHVIQNTEHFASGTNTVVATRYLINLAYDLVKNNPEFVAKKKPQDKMDYIIGYIEAKDNTTLDEYARYYYFRNHGETEARNTAKRLDMTDAERKAIPVVNDGDVYTRESVRSEFIDNLREMGYNKKQIDTIMKEGVSYDNKSEDEQKSLGQVGKRGGNLGRTVDGLLSQNLQRGTQREVHGNGEVQEVDSAEKAGQIGSVSGGVSRRTDSGASGLGEAGKRLNEVSKPEKRFSLSSADTDIYSRIFDMQREETELTNRIREIEKSDAFKKANDDLSKAINNDNIAEGMKAYQAWRKESGYADLVDRRDALRAELEEIRTKANNDAVSKAINEERTAIEKSGLSEADYFRKQAVKEFGYTPYFYDAGYIMPNGKMLNFSGEKGRHYGSRGQDHRAIGTIYADTNGTDALVRFMNDGNIRIMAETPGLDISASTEPSKEQYTTIRRFANEFSDGGYFAVDLSDENGKNVGTLEYEGNINPTRIANDIKHFYETGEVREQSGLDRFRYSLTRANDEYMKAVESGNVEEQQRLVDEAAENAGYNVRAWHGTKNRFTKFRLPIDELGVHFGTKSQARTFAGRGKNAVMQNDILSVHNPIKLGRDLGSWYPGNVARELYDNGILSKEETESILFTDDKRYRRQDSTAVKMLRELLTQKGYDAIIYPNNFDGKTVKDSYLIWDKENVKSADPITYDDSGNVIPLTERFDSGNRDIRWSLAGTNKDGIEVYETSDDIKNLTNKERMKRFEEIMKNDYRGRTAKFIRNGHAYYATFEDTDVKKNIYGDNQSSEKGWKAKIRAGADGDIFELVENADYTGSNAEQGKSNSAHNGIGFWDYYVKTVQIDNEVYDLLANVRRSGGDSYVYNIGLRPNKKIKASPPLGIQKNSVNTGAQRSDNSVSQNDSVVNTQSMQGIEKDSSDERHSLVKSAQSELKALQKENEKLRQDVDDLKQELQLTHGRKLSRDALISSIQKILIDRYGVKLSAKELYPHVTNLYDMFYNNTVDGKRLKKDERVDTMRIIEEMDKIVDAVIENTVGIDDTYVEMKKLLPELRNTKLVVPVDARADAAQSAGFENWAEFRKANFGRVGFANEGLPVDTYYMELSERYPELFPDGITHPGEQAAHIADVVNTIRESGINEYQLYDIEDERIRTSIKNDVMDIIGNAEKLQTFADRAAQKVEDTKLAEAMHYGADIANLKRLNAEKVADIKAENRKRLSDMRRKYQDRVESVRERYAEARANRSEKQKQTVLRNKVLRKYTEASSMLDRPTTENHFTEAMREPIMEFLAAVDITTGKSVAKQGIYDRILRVIEAANKATAEGGKNGLDIAETDLNVQEKQLIVDSGLLERMSAWVEANQGKKLTELSSAQLFDQIVSNEPPVGYVHLDLLQQPYFAADTVRISYEQHTEKNLRLDSRASVILAVIRLADSAGTSSSNTILSQA